MLWKSKDHNNLVRNNGDSYLETHELFPCNVGWTPSVPGEVLYLKHAKYGDYVIYLHKYCTYCRYSRQPKDRVHKKQICPILHLLCIHRSILLVQNQCFFINYPYCCLQKSELGQCQEIFDFRLFKESSTSNPMTIVLSPAHSRQLA
jgi:hypothetical protein